MKEETMRDACPSPEDLAAFLDGGLEGVERDRMVRHLNACPHCMDVYADVAEMGRTDQETGPMTPPAVPGATPLSPAHGSRLPASPRRRFVRMALPIAALLVAGVSGAWWWQRDVGRGAEWSAQLTALASPADLEGAVAQGLPRHRGESPPATGDPTWGARQLAFQLGARSVDLDVAVAARSPGLKKDLEPGLTRLLEEAEAASLLPEEPARRWRENEGEGFRRLEALGRDLQAYMAEAPDFALGRFTEGARLAVAAGQAEWFDRGAAGYPAWLLRQEGWPRLRRWQGKPAIHLRDEARRALRRAAAILEGGVDPAERPELRDALHGLIGLYDPEAYRTLKLHEGAAK